MNNYSLSNNKANINGLGFKIVDNIKEKHFIDVLINYINKQKNKVPLELAFYKDDLNFQKYIIDKLINANIDISFHLHTKKFTLDTLLRKNTFDYNELIKQLETMKKYNIKKAIFHLSNVLLENKDIEMNVKLYKLLYIHLKNINDILKDYDIKIYIENVFDSREFYLNLMKCCKDLEFIHFCLDIGHAKVWSGSSIFEWFITLKYMQSIGKDIHFHMHCNYGLFDNHISIQEYNKNREDKDIFLMKDYNLYGKDASQSSYEEIYKYIIENFSDNTKIMEIKPEYTIKEYEYLLSYINS